MLIHFRLQGIPGYKLKATLSEGAAPSPDNLAFYVYPRPGGPLWSDGLMKPLMLEDELRESEDAKMMWTNFAEKNGVEQNIEIKQCESWWILAALTCTDSRDVCIPQMEFLLLGDRTFQL